MNIESKKCLRTVSIYIGLALFIFCSCLFIFNGNIKFHFQAVKSYIAANEYIKAHAFLQKVRTLTNMRKAVSEKQDDQDDGD